jgi:hypothetical protein
MDESAASREDEGLGEQGLRVPELPLDRVCAILTRLSLHVGRRGCQLQPERRTPSSKPPTT